MCDPKKDYPQVIHRWLAEVLGRRKKPKLGKSQGFGEIVWVRQEPSPWIALEDSGIQPKCHNPNDTIPFEISRVF
jgi:hypothetical protein